MFVAKSLMEIKYNNLLKHVTNFDQQEIKRLPLDHVKIKELHECIFVIKVFKQYLRKRLYYYY